jgi:hypothetical protein
MTLSFSGEVEGLGVILLPAYDGDEDVIGAVEVVGLELIN